VKLDRRDDLVQRLGAGRLAMALVEAVPAGIYGKTALEKLGLWDSVAPRVAQTDNVRAALALVAVGAAPLGVVYASDAQAEPRVHVVAIFPETSHPPILYPAAAVAGRDTDAVRAFLDHLQSGAAQDALRAHGLGVAGQ
jgi:molybdate transport system substrate-binding protein